MCGIRTHVLRVYEPPGHKQESGSWCQDTSGNIAKWCSHEHAVTWAQAPSPWPVWWLLQTADYWIIAIFGIQAARPVWREATAAPGHWFGYGYHSGGVSARSKMRDSQAECVWPGRSMALHSIYMAVYDNYTEDLWYLAWDSPLLILHIFNKSINKVNSFFLTPARVEDLSQSRLGCLYYSQWSQQILLACDSLGLLWMSFLDLGKLHNSLTIKGAQVTNS